MSQVLIRSTILLLTGMILGGFLVNRLHGQSHNNLTGTEYQHIETMSSITALNVKVSGLEATVAEISRKLDKVQSQADTTEAMGAGIGLAITFLQLLGFFVKSKERQ